VRLPPHKTKIVCTIGPASEPPEVMAAMMDAGMNVARLNFSHGDFISHERNIVNLREQSRATGRRLAIMADLPGPKMRVGEIAGEPVELSAGAPFTLTTDDVAGDETKASVTFSGLPKAVKPGDALFLNDGYIQLKVESVEGSNVHSRVIVGGTLRSRKGLNLPGIDLGITAFTEHDRECLRFALKMGVDAVSQSFVESALDIEAVREAASALGKNPFIIAKIERSKALENIDGILKAADGIMIARGDLGVEIPIEEIALVQKELMQKANMLGKPVITATQMLESMTDNRRPTRAEATDVANAILDGTDCVMLSGESAMGKYPVEAVAMLGKIAATIEPYRPGIQVRKAIREVVTGTEVAPADLISLAVESALERMSLATILIPSRSGSTARRFARQRLPVWITAVSPLEATCQSLVFSYGVYAHHEPEEPDTWSHYAKAWVQTCELKGDRVILIEGPSTRHPEANYKMEIVDLYR
jgi:pyruvate kinase